MEERNEREKEGMKEGGKDRRNKEWKGSRGKRRRKEGGEAM